MPSTVEIRGGFGPLFAELAKVEPLLSAAAATLVQRAERTMNLSRRLAPVLDGTLRGGATVLPPEFSGTTVSVTMGYGGAASRYARKVHENPRSGRTGGRSPSGKKYRRWAQVGEWKFLEKPYLAEINGTFEALRESTMADLARRLKR